MILCGLDGHDLPMSMKHLSKWQRERSMRHLCPCRPQTPKGGLGSAACHRVSLGNVIVQHDQTPAARRLYALRIGVLALHGEEKRFDISDISGNWPWMIEMM